MAVFNGPFQISAAYHVFISCLTLREQLQLHLVVTRGEKCQSSAKFRDCESLLIKRVVPSGNGATLTAQETVVCQLFGTPSSTEGLCQFITKFIAAAADVADTRYSDPEKANVSLDIDQEVDRSHGADIAMEHGS